MKISYDKMPIVELQVKNIAETLKIQAMQYFDEVKESIPKLVDKAVMEFDWENVIEQEMRQAIRSLIRPMIQHIIENEHKHMVKDMLRHHGGKRIKGMLDDAFNDYDIQAMIARGVKEVMETDNN